MLLHLIAHALHGQRPLQGLQECYWVMRRLRARWPRALAACVMPDHLHLIVRATACSQAQQQLAHVLRGFTQHVGARRVWAAVPPPSTIPNAHHLARQIRYVYLNPTRAGLVPDPLLWTACTYRGVLGAQVQPWVSATRLAKALGRPPQPFRHWLHAYVSGDPSVTPRGSPPPRAAEATRVPAVALATILEAAAAATYDRSVAVRRHAFVLLAQHQGWHDTALLGHAAGITARQARTLAQRLDPELLEAAALCLGDARLRIGFGATSGTMRRGIHDDAVAARAGSSMQFGPATAAVR
jgi:hypothetical protein